MGPVRDGLASLGRASWLEWILDFSVLRRKQGEVLVKELTHGSLFTGVGMIDFGLQAAGFRTLWQVERDRYCLDVLRLRWPDVRKLTDIRVCGKHNLEPVTIISGAFPCQQVSVAGNMEGIGTADSPTDRSGLWFEQFRIVREMRPAWLLVENLDRLLRSDDGSRVISDLAAEGYSCWPIILGAKDLGAPHQRRRTWILGHDNDAHRDCHSGEGPEAQGLHPAAERAVAQAHKLWKDGKHELVTGNGGAGSDPEQQAQAYAGIVRDVHGNPVWLDRFKCAGNSVVFLVPAIIGSLVAGVERASGAS